MKHLGMESQERCLERTLGADSDPGCAELLHGGPVYDPAGPGARSLKLGRLSSILKIQVLLCTCNANPLFSGVWGSLGSCA